MLVAPIDLAISTANKRLGEWFDILFHCTASKETNISYGVYYHGIKRNSLAIFFRLLLKMPVVIPYLSTIKVAEDGMFKAKGMRKHNLYFF